MMRILEVATNAWHEVTIEEISPKDIRTLSRKRYFFDWKKVVGKAEIYKLTISGSNDIKGLMSLTDLPTENRIEINLLSAFRENVVFDPEKGKKQKEFYGKRMRITDTKNCAQKSLHKGIWHERWRMAGLLRI